MNTNQIKISDIIHAVAKIRNQKVSEISLDIANNMQARNVLFVTKKKAISSIESDYKLAGFTYNLTVTNYEQLKNFKDEKFDLIIVDEANSNKAYPNPSEKIKISDIIHAVAKIRNQKVSDIKSKSRKRELAESRHIICFIGQFANLSLRTIGSALSDRDHSTIIHGRDKAVDIMQQDENFKKQVNEAILCLRLDHIR